MWACVGASVTVVVTTCGTRGCVNSYLRDV